MTQAASKGAANWVIPAAAMAATAGATFPSQPTGHVMSWLVSTDAATKVDRAQGYGVLPQVGERHTLVHQAGAVLTDMVADEDFMADERLSDRADEVLRSSAIAMTALSIIIGGTGILINAPSLTPVAVAAFLLATFVGTAAR